jgi:hypothetical protein
MMPGYEQDEEGRDGDHQAREHVPRVLHARHTLLVADAIVMVRDGAAATTARPLMHGRELLHPHHLHPARDKGAEDEAGAYPEHKQLERRHH